MSEFTYAVVFEKRHERIVHDNVGDIHNHIIKPLNNTWSLLLLEDDLGEDDVEKYPKSRPMLMMLSDSLPLLIFFNAEDHEWGYELLHKAERVASYLRDYNLETSLIFELVEKRYPNQDPTELLYLRTNSPFKALQAEAQSSDAYLNAISTRYDQANPDAFSIMGIDDTKIAKLKALLRQDNGISERQEVEEFKILLDLQDLVYTNYGTAVADGCC